ncbi:MAG: hypothetical protein K2K97_04190 [Muribaculaceae bacterium]|nr:hypothetical protein [Muribaculaceae bacterium]
MKKYTISVDDAQFYIYTPSEKKIWGKDFWIIDFERRHDLLYTPASAGVIVQLNVTNKRYGSTPERGVRHKMKFSLVDTTLKTVVASLKQCIYVPKDEFFKHHYLQFPIDGLITRDIHVFKLVVFDETANCTLGEFFFNVFNEEILGSPAKWYWVSGGGLYPNGGHHPYKWVLPCNESYTEHGIEFDLQPRFGKNLPVILPELEIRIYKPDANYPDTQIVEVRKNGCSWWVNRSFLTGKKRGIYYVELTCMGHLIAGVPFGVYDDYTNNRWSHAELEAQEKYLPHDQDSAEKAAGRFINMLPKENRFGEEAEVAIGDFVGQPSEEDADECAQEAEKEEEVVDPLGAGMQTGISRRRIGFRV